MHVVGHDLEGLNFQRLFVDTYVYFAPYVLFWPPFAQLHILECLKAVLADIPLLLTI